jgi:hypothetical protein
MADKVGEGKPKCAWLTTTSTTAATDGTETAKPAAVEKVAKPAKAEKRKGKGRVPSRRHPLRGGCG